MPNVKISDLPAVGSLSNETILPVVKSGTTSKTTISAIKSFFNLTETTELDTAGALNDTDLLRLVQSEISKKLSLITLKNYILNGFTALPGQSGNSGKYLTTDGTNASWATVASGGSSLPAQSGQAGKYLTTDGTNASWATVFNGAPVSVAFNTTVPINNPITTMATTTISGATAFTPGALSAGCRTELVLIANGTNIPTFTGGFAGNATNQSVDWVNTNGKRHMILFETDGSIAWYTIGLLN